MINHSLQHEAEVSLAYKKISPINTSKMSAEWYNTARESSYSFNSYQIDIKSHPQIPIASLNSTPTQSACYTSLLFPFCKQLPDICLFKSRITCLGNTPSVRAFQSSSDILKGTFCLMGFLAKCLNFSTKYPYLALNQILRALAFNILSYSQSDAHQNSLVLGFFYSPYSWRIILCRHNP